MRIGELINILFLGQVFLCLASADSALSAENVRIEKTSAEYASNPIGLDIAQPRLSWILGSDERNQVQTAYEIKVASTTAALATPDIWDSGKINSSQSNLVSYGGPPLSSRTRYYWTVRVWDSQDRPSAWSKPAWWEMGLLSEHDWHAQWIAHDHPAPPPPPYLTGVLIPEELKAGETQGQSFTATTPIKSVALIIPTFQTKDSSVTLSLYKNGPGGHLLARQHFEGVRDGEWVTLNLRQPLMPGKYYIEESEVAGRIGWYSSKKIYYDFGDAYLNGKPVSGVRKIRLDSLTFETQENLSPEIRRNFTTQKEIKSARLYATALGLYKATINGKLVGNDLFSPGWTDYNKRIQYQTYDVTELVRRGKNAIAVTLAPGWYAGNVGAFGPGQFGVAPALLMQLEITYSDGNTEQVVTNSDWKSHTGPLRQADLIAGETYDARKETTGWDLPDFDDSGWKRVRLKKGITAKLTAQVDPPIRTQQELRPVSVSKTKTGSYIYDLGQNMVGAVRLRVSGRPGQTIVVRHAEVLNHDGSLYTDNLRTAKATDTYILKGKGVESFEPVFTFHGFRYVEVIGADAQPEVVGKVMYTDAPISLSFSTNVPMLNQLQSNIVWGQRGNFLSVPMDTPTRDERLGWTGDIAAFADTAAYNMDIATFLGKWLIDLRETQSPDGEFAAVAPLADTMAVGKAGPGWGDAGVIVPWALYEQYGDRRLLEENFNAMTRWVSFLSKNSTGYLRAKEGYGDWLNVNDDTPKDLIATAFFAYSTAIVAKAASALGKDSAQYVTLFRQIRDAFVRSFLLPNGRLAGDSQTGYVLALSMDLLPPASRKVAVDRLVELIRERNWHLSTGFLGTPRILEVLSENGHTDVAYRLLLQTSFPSWGYQIGKGATTPWERWDAIRPDDTFQDANMNSFNHYAFGAAGKWMYQNVAGIRPAEPGFQKIIIKPRLGSTVLSVDSQYESAYGTIESRWKLQDGYFTLNVNIPVNTTAQIWVPIQLARKIDSDGTDFLYNKDGYAVYKTGSGSYQLTAH